MIDRDARNRLLEGIDDYMDDKISPEVFDRLLHDDISLKTKDETIQEISRWLFYSYEDIGTDRLQTDCRYWKFLNRLRLLLASNTEYHVEPSPSCKSSVYRFIAGSAIVALPLFAVCCIGFDRWDVLLTGGIFLYATCGIVFLALLFLGNGTKENGPTPRFEMYPFETFAELLAVRRSVLEFESKCFYRKPIAKQPSKRSRWIAWLWETNCPAWVDRIGDGFIAGFWYVYGVGLIFVLWPLFALLILLNTPNRSRFTV